LIFQNGEIPGNLPEFPPEGANFGRSARIRHLSRDRASSHGRPMESHEWKLNGEDGKRFYRGNYMSGRWATSSGKNTNENAARGSGWPSSTASLEPKARIIEPFDGPPTLFDGIFLNPGIFRRHTHLRLIMRAFASINESSICLFSICA
jgi:hypothetical protein